MKKFILFTLLFIGSTAPAFADTTAAWCPQDAVCSQRQDTRVIVYDPNGSFRQTTLATQYVPVSERAQHAAKYGVQNNTQVYAGNTGYTKQYYFRTAGNY